MRDKILPEIYSEIDPLETVIVHSPRHGFYFPGSGSLHAEPIILKNNKYQTVHIDIENGQVKSIQYIDNLLSGLESLGMSLKPIFTGGTKDLWIQEREQWHSGANFFALGPGKVLGYSRNEYTMEEMNKHGYEIIKAKDFLDGIRVPGSNDQFVIALEGSELARGGGGARCMTMPIVRQRKKDKFKNEKGY